MESERALSRPLLDRSTNGVPQPLNLGRKVFLSHSGIDKLSFVWFLHDALCQRYHDTIAFFDILSLPKGKAVSMDTILEEARGSELGVLVLTEDFFVQTPNPMLELEALVASQVQLLPLFFGMSVDEFKKKIDGAVWEKRWKEWSVVGKDEGRIKRWRHALRVVSKINGLEYCKAATNHPEYIEKIVKEVTRIIRPAISFSGEGVYGKDRLCQIVKNMYKRCASKHSSNDPTQIASTSDSSGAGEEGGSTVDVVGIYGFAGVGKSTLCACLCDFYFQEFNGNVCHIDLGSVPSEPVASQTYNSSDAVSKRRQHVLSMLIGNNKGGHDSPNPRQIEVMLKAKLSTNPVFLAIDNILPDTESQEEVDFYLMCKFRKGSKVFITSKSQGILKSLTDQHSNLSVVIEYMPALELIEAREIFVHEFPDPGKFGISNNEDDVNELANMCIIHEGGYHPLMLKSVAAFMRRDRTWKVKWKERLAKLRSEGIADKSEAWEKVFKLLDMSYGLLREDAEKLFMDLALFYNATRDAYAIQDWIESVYSHFGKEKTEKIILQLQDLCFAGQTLEPPDLMVEFTKYKALDGQRRSPDPRYLVAEDDTPCPDEISGHVRHVSISRLCAKERMLDLRDVEGVEVLHLVNNAGLQEVLLSRTTCARLRSVIVRVAPGTSLRFTMDEDWSVPAAGRQRGGASPRWVQLEGNVILPSLRRARRPSNVLSRSLGHLEIIAAPVLDLGSLGNLINLERLQLSGLPVQRVDLMACTKLKELSIWQCDELLALSIPNNRMTSWIGDCESLRRVSLCTASSYPEAGSSSGRDLSIMDCPTVSEIDGLVQYTGRLEYSSWNSGARDSTANLEGTFGYLLKSAGIDSSTCKARVNMLGLSVSNLPGLADVEVLHVEDAQHIGLLIAALFAAQPEGLRILRIVCKKGGDCGCDERAPTFGPLPKPASSCPLCKYCCPQVRDLGSLAQWNVLTHLNLSGCTSVEVWPDFATMSSLEELDLSDTSLKEWPNGLAQCNVLTRLDLSGCTSVEVWPDFATMSSLEDLDLSNTCLKEWPNGLALLRRLNWLDMRGCRQLAAQELTKVIALEQDVELCVCSTFALHALICDMGAGIRDSCSVMDALESQFHELWQDGSFDSWHCHIQVVYFIITLFHDFWFEGVESVEGASGCNSSRVERMRRPLCSAFFMSVPFHLWWCGRGGFEGPHVAFALMAMAVVGGASIGWYNAAINKDLKHRIIAFLRSFSQDKHVQGDGSNSIMLQQDHFYPRGWPFSDFGRGLSSPRKLVIRLSERPQLLFEAVPMLAERVVRGVWKMARAAEDELGPEFIQGLGATFMSTNFLQYDVKWLLSYSIKYGNYQSSDGDSAYHKLLGDRAFDDVYRTHNRQPLFRLFNKGPQKMKGVNRQI